MQQSQNQIIKTNLQEGSVLIITILILGIMLFLSAWYISSTLTGSRISQSQEKATKSYYLTEAGINQAIWKLENDETTADGDDPWETCFTSNAPSCPDCKTWEDSFQRSYAPNSTTTVSIKNSYCGQGEIIATTTLAFGKTVSQRVVRTKVFKALGSLTQDSPLFAGAPSGESTIQASKLNVFNGNIFSNSTINIKLDSEVNVYDNPSTNQQEGQVLSVGNLNITNSTLNASSTCAKNVCTQDVCKKCPADSYDMPAVDFDSNASTSYKSRATKAEQEGQCSVVGKNSDGDTLFTSNKCIFSENDFADMLWNVGSGGTLVLEYKANGAATSTYYVEGGVDLKGGRNLEIHGVLVTDDTVNIGEKLCWIKGWNINCGLNQLKVFDPGEGIPSGVLTKGRMNFGLYTSFKDIDVTGLIYSQQEMRLSSLPQSFNIEGGIVARKFSLTSTFSPLNIYLNNDIIREGIWGSSRPPVGAPVVYSPVVTIEHWEESY